ncbi:MAG: hypothetical protein DI603_08970 [Roseateles depolymerans]|uniref:Uncharacterized protein n=1 Tax=Roseateles depolymerans TaxID=76731 RepID=A0A2W5DNK4_9BURK|nr:MAG: hypothetical protein DI603_08970 [Roseateles depolymerans]
MNERHGLHWPLDAAGRPSSGAPGRTILAAALQDLAPEAAAALLAERDWRRAYPRHWRALVAAQLHQPGAVVASARAGLAAAHQTLPFWRDGRALPLPQAMAAPRTALQTLTLAGQGDARPRPWAVPWQGRLLQGDELARQLDRWAADGLCEPGHVQALHEARAHPEWFDLSDQQLVLLGAGSEAGPLPLLAGWRARILAVEPAGSRAWPRIAAAIAAGNATLQAPVAAGRTPGLDTAGADLLTDTPEIAAWLAGFSADGPLAIASLAYLDGERHVRVSLAMDAIAAALCDADARTRLAYMATPTDLFAVPEALARAVQARAARQGPAQRLGAGLLRTLSGGRLYAPHLAGLETLTDGAGPATWGLVDALVLQQGPNYALAKRLQQWRALTAHADGHEVSFAVAPSTTTASVVSNPLLAAAFRGAPAFGVQAFAPDTTRALMAGLWVHRLRSPRPAFRHPLELLVQRAHHGGLWSLPWLPRSVLPLAALLGLTLRR